MELVRKASAGDVRRPRELKSEIPKSLEAVCMKAMSKVPGDRYSSPVALAEDLEKWLADEPVSVYVEPLSTRIRRWIRRHPVVVSTSAACIVLGQCAATIVAYQEQSHAAALADKNFELTLANQKAEEARRRAEDREQDAIDAVKRFGDAIADNAELKNSPNLEPLRKELLKEPIGFFRTLRERLRGDKDPRPESLARLANAAFDLGELTDEIGERSFGRRNRKRMVRYDS
ncbi:MAG: hypothetical protein U0892_09480 [Pirellulales bacterium]